MYEFSKGKHGFGALPGDDGCPDGSSRFGIPGGQCIQVVPQTSPQCPAGQTAVVDPSGSGFFICMPSGAQPPVPVPSAPTDAACPDGSIGMPPFCFTVPAAAPVVPAACPPGQIGIPPNCFSTGAGPAPSVTPPAPVPVTPTVTPAVTPATIPPPPVSTPPSSTGTLLLLGVGAVGLYFVFRPKRAVANRRRRRHAYR